MQSFPQRVTAPMYPDDDPHIAYLCVQNPSSGIFPDDDLVTSVTVNEGGHLTMTSQGATQVFAGDSGPCARHSQTLTVRSKATLEYLPREIIPQSASRLDQRTTIDVATGGVYVGWEMVAAGRIAHGERFAYRDLGLRTSVAVDREVLVRECVRLSGRRRASRLVGVDYFATLLIVCPGRDHVPLRAVLTDVTDAWVDVTAGVSELPSSCGVIVRLIAGAAPPLQRGLAELLGAYRAALFGMAAPSSRLVR